MKGLAVKMIPVGQKIKLLDVSVQLQRGTTKN